VTAAIDGLGRVKTRQRATSFPFSGNTRPFNGIGVVLGITLTAQATAGGGIQLFEGFAETGALIATIDTSTWTAGRAPYRLALPVQVRRGVFIKCLGTGQVGTVQMGEV
jgi:hypothetical protein